MYRRWFSPFSLTQPDLFASGSLLFAPRQRMHRMPALPMTVNLSCPSCTSITRIPNGKCRSSAKCTWRRFKNEVCPSFAHCGESFSACLAIENMPTSSILQQSLNEMQTLHAQQSFYSDPLCRNIFACFKIFESHSCLSLSLAASTMHNRSVISKPLVNTSVYSPSHTTVSVQPNASIAQSSYLNGGVSKADVPYRSLASFGVLSK